MSSTSSASATTTPSTRARLVTHSLGAVLAGFIVFAVLSAAADAICLATGPHGAPDDSKSILRVLLAAAYRHLFQAIGSYFTAHLAPSAPRYHVALLSLVDLVLSMQS